MKERVTTAVVGLGNRGYSLTRDVFLGLEDVDILGVCDLYEDRIEKAAALIKEKRGTDVVKTKSFDEILSIPGLDSVIITTSWETHIPMAIKAMEKGIRPGVEVGAAYNLEQLWDLVHTYERTNVPCMLLENCCYGRIEMMLMHMVDQGFFGKLVHTEGGYRHDLRDEIGHGREDRHYRNANYFNRNTENYPTHELGPLCQMMGVHKGNRMVKLNAVASTSRGLHDYLMNEKGSEYDQVVAPFMQGDVVTTVITLAHGETITLTLDTTLPRYYSRGLVVQGTKAMFSEDNQSIFEDGKYDEMEGFYWEKHWGNIKEYQEQYESPTWKQFLNDGVRGGHGGMDYLVDRAFFDSVKYGTNPPIDVYDMAAWMSIGVLAEESILKGGAPVTIPDFTGGRWFKTYKTE